MPVTAETRIDQSSGSDPMLRYPALRSAGVPFSRQHIAVLEARGEFPRRVRLSERVIAWRRSEILEWLASRGRG